MEPRPLKTLVESSRFEAVKRAIVAELKRLMPGVTVQAHVGKLDINDVIARSIVPAPGVAVGWTRIRAPRDPDGGTFTTLVEWSAYVVAEPKQLDELRVERETIAHAIGVFLLEILADPTTSSWGLTGLSPALTDPAPQFTPILTVKSVEAGIACYAVSWSQALMDCGASLFDEHGDVTMTPIEGGAEVSGMPPEIVAALWGSDVG